MPKKRDLAAKFFEKLGQGTGSFITDMIEAEMDSDLIELFNQLGGQLQMGDMEQERFHTSLLIIGYLVRAYEQAGGEEPPGGGGEETEDSGPAVH